MTEKSLSLIDLLLIVYAELYLSTANELLIEIFALLATGHQDSMEVEMAVGLVVPA